MYSKNEFEHENADIENKNSMNFDNNISSNPIKSLPKKIKLEITTAFEMNTTILVVVAVITTIALLNHFHEKGIMFNFYTLMAIAISIALIILRNNIDEYYVLDTDRHALMLRKKLFSKETYTMFAHFKTIEAAVGNGLYNSGGKNTPGYWEYRAEIILKTGKVIPIDDWHKEALNAANSKAKRLADIANADFIQGMHGVEAKPIMVNGKHTFLVKENPPMQTQLSSIVVGLIIMAMVGGMAYFATNLL